MENHWMQTAVKHPGAFTKKAKEAGMSDHMFATHVMSHKNKYDTETIRQANLALVFEGAHHKAAHGSGKKHATLKHVKSLFGTDNEDRYETKPDSEGKGDK